VGKTGLEYNIFFRIGAAIYDVNYLFFLEKSDKIIGGNQQYVE